MHKGRRLRKQEWEDSEIHRHTGLSMHKKREQLKESTETLRRPDQQAKVNYTTQASCWLGLQTSKSNHLSSLPFNGY